MSVCVPAKLKKPQSNLKKKNLNIVIFTLVSTNIPVYTRFPQEVNSLGSLQSMSSF